MKKVYLLLTILIIFCGCSKDDKTSTTPVACFTYTSPETTVFVGDNVNFLNCSTDAESYKWDFGDGSSSTEKDPTHAFDQSKQFDVLLTAYGKGGTPSDTVMVKIKVWLHANN